MKKQTRIYTLLIIVALFLSACNLPSSNVEDTAGTAAAQTVQALLNATPTSGAVTIPSSTPPPAAPASLTPIPLPVLTNTPAVTATSNCNVAQFIADVTIPDGTVMTPGQTFVKKWRVKNIGSCAWNGFSLVFDSGDAMGAPASKPIALLNAGQEIDLEVNLVAPATPTNSVRSYWRITTNANVLVPIVNGYQGKSFYVDIKVQAATTISPSPTVTLTPTATLTPAPVVFAVTSVTFSVSGACPNFSYTYNITANAAGTVTSHRVFSDGGTDTAPRTFTFSGAGTQSVTESVFFNVPGSSSWTEIYIDTPNNQQFGRATFTCP